MTVDKKVIAVVGGTGTLKPTLLNSQSVNIEDLKEIWGDLLLYPCMRILLSMSASLLETLLARKPRGSLKRELKS